MNIGKLKSFVFENRLSVEKKTIFIIVLYRIVQQEISNITRSEIKEQCPVMASYTPTTPANQTGGFGRQRPRQVWSDR